MMQTRQIRGLEIASRPKRPITNNGTFWAVPSQTTSVTYAVTIDPPHCTCPDFKKSATKCKHIFAVEYYITKESGETLPDVPEQKSKTYKQEWHEYNLAQTNEKAKFLELLYELCQNIEDLPKKPGAGRSRLPMRDMIFASVFKIYCTLSGRRFISDLREAFQRGYLSRIPHFNSIFNYLELEEMTTFLKQLIIESSLPLKSVESDFAVDSSGFSTGISEKWVDAKWEAARLKYKNPDAFKRKALVNRNDWLKAHIMCGIKTNIVTSIEVTHGHGADSPRFRPLVEATSQNFPIASVMGDKAYSSVKNLQLVLVKGGQPYIAFRSDAKGENKSSAWNRVYHYYRYNEEEYMNYYHRRSNVESTFSMIKRKFGDKLRSRTFTSQTNEVLAKILAHNLCCVIQSMYELGVEVNFCAESSAAQELT